MLTQASLRDERRGVKGSKEELGDNTYPLENKPDSSKREKQK